jgi:hypothetical protein
MQRANAHQQAKTQVEIVLECINKVVSNTTSNLADYSSVLSGAFGVTDSASAITRLLWLTELLDQAQALIENNVRNDAARNKHCNTILQLRQHIVRMANTDRRPVAFASPDDAATLATELEHHNVALEIGKQRFDEISEYLKELKAMPSFEGDPDEFDKWTEEALRLLQHAIRDYPLVGIVAFEKQLADLVFRMARTQRCFQTQPRSARAKKTQKMVAYLLEFCDDAQGYQVQNRIYDISQFPPVLLVADSPTGQLGS